MKKFSLYTVGVQDYSFFILLICICILKMVFLLIDVFGFCLFKIHSGHLSLLIGMCTSFTFNVIIDLILVLFSLLAFSYSARVCCFRVYRAHLECITVCLCVRLYHLTDSRSPLQRYRSVSAPSGFVCCSYQIFYCYML